MAAWQHPNVANAIALSSKKYLLSQRPHKLAISPPCDVNQDVAFATAVVQ